MNGATRRPPLSIATSSLPFEAETQEPQNLLGFCFTGMKEMGSLVDVYSYFRCKEFIDHSEIDGNKYLLQSYLTFSPTLPFFVCFLCVL